jgi:hypothetical protein
MPKGILVALADAADGRDADFNEWYDKVHGPEVASLPGFKSFTRYKVVEGSRVPEGTPTYCAVYELEADDLNAAVAGIGAAAREGKLHMSDSIKLDPPPGLIVYEILTERTEP